MKSYAKSAFLGLFISLILKISYIKAGTCTYDRWSCNLSWDVDGPTVNPTYDGQYSVFSSSPADCQNYCNDDDCGTYSPSHEYVNCIYSI